MLPWSWEWLVDPCLGYVGYWPLKRGIVTVSNGDVSQESTFR